MIFITVNSTVLFATAVRAVPILYQVAPKSSEPSSCRAGAVVATAPILTISCVALPQSRVRSIGVVLLSVVRTIVLSTSCRWGKAG